jgi:hypothetical protein
MVMKRITALVFIGIQLFALLCVVSVSHADNNLIYPQSNQTESIDKPDILINGAIDLLGRADDKKSPFYDPEFSAAVKQDIQQLLISSRALVLNEDFKQIIIGLDKIMMLNDSSELSRNTLAKYLKQILKSMTPLADSATLKELLLTVTAIDKNLFYGDKSITEGLIMMASNNMYGQKRVLSDVNTSALRSLLFMIACADFIPNLEVKGKDTGFPVLSLLDSPDHPLQEPGTVKSHTTNLADWFIGEIVTAVRWGREGKIKINDRYVYMNQFQAYDWLMFKKKYQLSGVGYEPLTFEGIVGVISHTLVQSIMPAPIIDAFPAIIELGGGMTDAEYHGGQYNGFTATSWKNRYGTAGKRHKLLALFIPIMEYWWNAKDAHGRQRISELIQMMVSLNEIPVAGYVSLDRGTSSNPEATFRSDNQFAGKSVLKTIEDNKFLSALLRKHAPNDSGLAPPAVDLCFRIVNKLNSPRTVPDDYLRANPGFSGKTFLDIIFVELDNAASEFNRRTSKANSNFIDRAFELLFIPLEGERNSIITKLGAVIHVAAQTTEDERFVATFKKDLGNFLDAAEKLIATADIEQIIRSLNAVMALNDNPDPQKNTLAKFAGNALRGLAPISDGDTIKGMLIALADMDAKELKDTARLNDDLIMILTTNMYGQKLETSEIKTSELRTLLFMIQSANVERHVILAGIDTGIPLLRMVDSPDHPYNEPGTVKDQTLNIAQWAIGEIVTAIRWGREGKIKLNDNNVLMDKFQAFDWVMYKKRYELTFVGVSLMSFNGMAGMLSNNMVKFFMPPAIVDTFPALVDLGGGMTEAEYARGTFGGFTSQSWKERYGTAGKRHKLLALAAPLMEYCWSHKDANGKQRSGDMVQVLAGLNEIPLPPVYQKLNNDNPDATFRKDNYPSVIKAIEDSGLLTYVVKKRGETDIVVPALDLLVTVVSKLNQKDSAPPEYKINHSDFSGNTVLDVLFAEMNIKGYKQIQGETSDPIQQIINALFLTKPGESQNVVTRLQKYLQRLVDHLYKNSGQRSQQGANATKDKLLSDSGFRRELL